MTTDTVTLPPLPADVEERRRTANREALSRLVDADPHLVGVAPAGEVVPGIVEVIGGAIPVSGRGRHPDDGCVLIVNHDGPAGRHDAGCAGDTTKAGRSCRSPPGDRRVAAQRRRGS